MGFFSKNRRGFLEKILKNIKKKIKAFLENVLEKRLDQVMQGFLVKTLEIFQKGCL